MCAPVAGHRWNPRAGKTPVSLVPMRRDHRRGPMVASRGSPERACRGGGCVRAKSKSEDRALQPSALCIRPPAMLQCCIFLFWSQLPSRSRPDASPPQPSRPQCCNVASSSFGYSSRPDPDSSSARLHLALPTLAIATPQLQLFIIRHPARGESYHNQLQLFLPNLYEWYLGTMSWSSSSVIPARATVVSDSEVVIMILTTTRFYIRTTTVLGLGLIPERAAQ